MSRFLGTASWNGAGGLQTPARAAASVLTLALVSWWLWGDTAWDHLRALGGQLREVALGAESAETRLRVADLQIQKARDEAKRLAEVIGGLEVRIETLDREIDRARGEQFEHKSLLAEFQRRLAAVPAGDYVAINGRRFDWSDMEHEAEQSLDRFNAAAVRLDELDARRRELAQRKAEMQSALRNHLRRVRELDLNQERIRDLKEQQEFAQWMDADEGWRADGEALRRAESTQNDLMHDLEAGKRARRMIHEQINGPAAPITEALRRELNPQKPLVERIEQAIGG